MKSYYRYPMVTAIMMLHLVLENTAYHLPRSDTLIPSTSGDLVSLIATMCAVMAGGVLFQRQGDHKTNVGRAKPAPLSAPS